MITSQEIRSKTFEKAVIGGYDMGGIDRFIDEVAEDIALMQKENVTLRSKLKVLAKSVEEYRSNEDALRMALISAQKLCVAIEKEARENAETIVGDASAQASKILGDANALAELESTKLSEARRTTASSIQAMTQMCQTQLDLLHKMAAAPDFQAAGASRASASFAVDELINRLQPTPEHVREPENMVHETIRSIEATVAKAADAPVLDVKPEIEPAPVEADEYPTRAFYPAGNDDSPFIFDNFGAN